MAGVGMIHAKRLSRWFFNAAKNANEVQQRVLLEPGPQQGEVVQVDGVGGLVVSVGGRTVTAKPVTDEPYRVGAKVWVSASSEGWIVHGGVR